MLLIADDTIVGVYKFLAPIQNLPWSLWTRATEQGFHQIIIISDREIEEFRTLGESQGVLDERSEHTKRDDLFIPSCREASDIGDLCGFHAFYVCKIDKEVLIDMAMSYILFRPGPDTVAEPVERGWVVFCDELSRSQAHLGSQLHKLFPLK